MRKYFNSRDSTGQTPSERASAYQRGLSFWTSVPDASQAGLHSLTLRRPNGHSATVQSCTADRSLDAPQDAVPFAAGSTLSQMAA